jgi:hypothetical protein
MIKRLFLAAAISLTLCPALVQAQAQTITIGLIGKSSVANTAAYGTVVDALLASNSSGGWVHGITWSVSNSDFFIDAGGDLHTNWQSIIAPGAQSMTITASAPGYTTATLALTVTVTGTMATQTMVITAAQAHTVYTNSPQGTIAYSLTVSQPNGTVGNLSSGVTWTVDNPLFTVESTMANAGIYYLATTWTGQIASGPQTVNLTASAPGYTTATLSLTIAVVAAGDPSMTISVNGPSSIPDNVVAGTVVDTLAATSSGAAVQGVTFSVNNSNFAVSAGNLATSWTSPISEGSQSMTITASAPGFTTATLPLTVNVTAPCQ